VPIYVELPADLMTPCMAYLRVAKDSKYSFLLESIIAGENIARYSFIGSGQFLFMALNIWSNISGRSFQGDKDRTERGDQG
jgi:anthranilate synthase component 1